MGTIICLSSSYKEGGELMIGKRTIFVTFVFLVIILIGYAYSKNFVVNGGIISIQEEYLKGKKFNIISSNGISLSYVLDKEMLREIPCSITWGIQNIDVQNYIGKNIDVYSYIVNNHKLDSYGDMNQTFVFLIICEKKIIGGYSIPYDSKPLYAGVYSIDGGTFEEVTGIDYQEWINKWVKKYS